jgi:hypothetical protein
MPRKFVTYNQPDFQEGDKDDFRDTAPLRDFHSGWCFWSFVDARKMESHFKRHSRRNDRALADSVHRKRRVAAAESGYSKANDAGDSATISTVVKHKEHEIARIRAEIDALQTVIPLLDTHPDDMTRARVANGAAVGSA